MIQILIAEKTHLCHMKNLMILFAVCIVALSSCKAHKERIAIGSGKDLTEVNAFMNQFEQTKQMMKSMNSMPIGGTMLEMRRK